MAVSASDPNGDALAYTLGGDDAAHFSISSDGVIAFTEIPDFEAPLDADQNNNYELTVTVSDGSLTDSINIVIDVRNALEGRVVDGPVAGATVFLDLDADGTRDDGEAQTTSNDAGYFFLDVASDPQALNGQRLVAVGGTDLLTNLELDGFVLSAKIATQPFDVAQINALTTILDLAEIEGSTESILNGFDVTAAPETVLKNGFWQGFEAGDLDARSAAAANVILSNILAISDDLADDGEVFLPLALPYPRSWLRSQWWVTTRFSRMKPARISYRFS